MPTPQESIARAAAEQHGCFTRDQARTSGFSNRQIADRIDNHVWLRLTRRTLAVSGTPPTDMLHIMAAVLSFPGAVASHLTAAWLHGMAERPGADPTLSRPHGSKSRPAAPRIVQTRWLPRHHIVRVDGIPVTTRARTLFDLAAGVPTRQLERMVDIELATRRLTLRHLNRIASDMTAPGRPGSADFARVLDDRQPGYVAPESELERRFIALCEGAGLPTATRQLRAPWQHRDGPTRGRVDFAWPERQLVCEVDGRRHHGLSDGFETDRLRDQLAIAAGWRTVRFSWRQVTDDPEPCCARLWGRSATSTALQAPRELV